MATEPAPPPHRDRNEAASSPEIPPDQSEENSTTAKAAQEDVLPREADATTRSGRYALIAALCAALISSVVSASAAVYVTVNKADRDQQLALIQVTRENRQKSYYEFLASTFNFVEQTGKMAGLLRVDNLDGFRSATVEFSQRMNKFLSTLYMASMTSSEDMIHLLAKFPEETKELLDKHYMPFVQKYTVRTEAPSDSDERKLDGAALDTVLMNFINRLDSLVSDFIEQGRRDLG
ncbi:hypothetical protein ACIHAX_03660 [Nocardia sp. NPDC051929]|uniref:hypothetical protein n=1 Tax=Nocardia sp. NPDC051929 TaxID=3364327 RepID=UPI0037C62533